MENVSGEKLNILLGEGVSDTGCVRNIKKMMHVDYSSVYDILGSMFHNIGLASNSVVISEVLRTDTASSVFMIQADDEHVYKIIISKRGDVVGGVNFYVKDTDGNAWHYKCKTNKGTQTNDLVDMQLKRYSINDGDCSIECFKDAGHVEYLFTYGSSDGQIKQQVNFDVRGTDVEEVSNIVHDRCFCVENEEDLVKYFRQLSYPVELGNVYEDVTKMYFGNDVCKYSEYYFGITTKKCDEEKTYVTDQIDLNNGNLVRFKLSPLIADGSFPDDYITISFADGKIICQNGFSDMGVNYQSACQAVSMAADELMELFPEQANKFLKCNASSTTDGEKQFSKVSDLK